MSGFDILTALEESGLDDIAIKIINYLNPKELLTLFQGTYVVILDHIAIKIINYLNPKELLTLFQGTYVVMF